MNEYFYSLGMVLYRHCARDCIDINFKDDDNQ